MSVGALPALTYRSASPVPPEVAITRLEAPAGTAMVKLSEVPVAAPSPVLGTPLVSTVLSPPLEATVTEAVLVLVAPALSVTVSETV